jgi:transcription elongation factor GreA
MARWEAADTDDAREAIMSDAAKNLAVAPNNPEALFTAAYGHELVEDGENAGKGYLRLARTLAAAENWVDVREVTLRALPLWGDYRLARLLLGADNRIADEEQKAEDIALARLHCPESPDVLWLTSQAADADGNEHDAARFAAVALKRYVELKDGGRAEEPLLRVLETGDRVYLGDMIELLPKMIAEDLGALVVTALDFGLPEIRKCGLIPQLIAALENVLVHGKPPDWMRGTYVDILAESLGGKERLKDIIADSKIADEGAPFEKALARFRELCVYRPGAYIEHNTWGIGEIQANDGSALVIDFADRQSHKMDLQIARRALRPLDDNLLRVVAFRDPETLTREAAEDPIALVVRAVKEVPGDATAKEIKPLLANIAFPENHWTNWWREARTRAATDPRIDASKVHKGVYALAKEGQVVAEVELPPLDTKKGLKGAVLAIGRMIKQNPAIEAQVREHYGPQLRKWAAEANNPDDRLRGLVYLSRWYPDDRAHWVSAAGDSFAARRTGVVCLSTPEDQAKLLELGLASGAWKEAALSGLASRFTSIRQQAADVLAERLGEGLVSALNASLLEATRHPQEALSIADQCLQGTLPLPEGTCPNPWDLLHATLLVLISAESKTLYNEALEVLDPQDELARRLVGTECPPDALERFEATSARYELLSVAAEAAVRLLTDTGHEEMIGPVLGERYVDKGEDLIGLHFSPRVTLMTQATYDRSRAEVETMRRELATTIPQEIAAARALGDLRENAEYHAAREKQGIMTAMEKTLSGELQQARIIDGLQMPDGVVGVATVVTLRHLDTDETQDLWLLGHRDNEMYDAINYRAPLGQGLCGKKVGELVEVELDGSTARLEIVAVRHRSPVGEPTKLPVPEPPEAR